MAAAHQKESASDDFGHNNITGTTTADLPGTVATRWQRVWDFDKTDVGANGGLVDLTFDFSDAGMSGTPSGEYSLLKRSGGSGPFSVIATSSSISGDQVLFSGVNADDLGSYFTLGYGNPTAVALAAFTATLAGSAVLLQWETATELDSLGFNLYRADTADGELFRLNPALVPSQAPGSPVGGVYSFLDETVTPAGAYSYWLEAVDVQGAVTRYGPVSAVVQAPSRYRVFLPFVARTGSGQ